MSAPSVLCQEACSITSALTAGLWRLSQGPVIAEESSGKISEVVKAPTVKKQAELRFSESQVKWKKGANACCLKFHQSGLHYRLTPEKGLTMLDCGVGQNTNRYSSLT